MKISINNIDVDENSFLGMDLSSEGETHQIRFSMPERFVPAPDLVGLAIATLLGSKYSDVTIDLPLTDRTVTAIETITKSSVNAPKAQWQYSASPGKNIALNFSGGFDSLAALTLLPDETKMVSLDFGGAFKREADFFNTFETTTIQTNFRSLGYANNHWTFMGISSILLRDYLEIDTYSFGSILEASPWNFQQTQFSNASQPVFAAAGIKQLNPVLGLTEIGTVMLLVKHSPDLVLASLRSLAAPGSEKFNRKVMLLNIVQDFMGTDIGLRAEQDRTTAHFSFGKSLASDFLALYIMKRSGRSQAEQLVHSIPDEASAFISGRSLNFYEKLNQIFCDSLPRDQRNLIYSRCLEAQILPYGEKDWMEYRDTIEFLSTWHKGLGG